MKDERKFLIFVFLFAFLIRFIYLISFVGTSPELLPIEEKMGDASTYQKMAINFLSGKGIFFSEEIVPSPVPFYPLFISTIYFLFGSNVFVVKLFQTLISALTTIIIYFMGKEVIGERVGKVASLIFTLYPFSIFYSGLLLTETLFTLLFSLSILFLLRMRLSSFKYSIGAGILTGVGSLTKPTLGAFPVFVLLYLSIIFHHSKIITLKKFSLFLLSFLFALAPWTFRNYLLFHRFIPLSPGIGGAFYTGNNPLNKTGGGIGGVDVRWPEEIERMEPSEQQRYLFKESINWIRNNPKAFLILTLKKFYRFWRPFPYTSLYASPLYKIVGLLSDGILIPLGLLGFFISLSKWRNFLILYLAIFYFNALHTILFSSLRYRFPIMPEVIILASLPILWLFNKSIKPLLKTLPKEQVEKSP